MFVICFDIVGPLLVRVLVRASLRRFLHANRREACHRKHRLFPIVLHLSRLHGARPCGADETNM